MKHEWPEELTVLLKTKTLGEANIYYLEKAKRTFYHRLRKP